MEKRTSEKALNKQRIYHLHGNVDFNTEDTQHWKGNTSTLNYKE